ncbi:hypothetical protein N9H56_03795 [Pseudomonadales bacterium]|nr:hypothetical protein [Pseudomonadales bacterium]
MPLVSKKIDRRLMSFRILPILALLFASSHASSVDSVAQEDVDSLYKIVMRLTNRVNDLEEQVSDLERQKELSPNKAPRPVNFPGPNASSKAWHNLANWNRLKEGMSEARVKQILGKPTLRTVDFIGYVTLRYTGADVDGVSLTGNVKLNADDQIRYNGVKRPIR